VGVAGGIMDTDGRETWTYMDETGRISWTEVVATG